MEDDFFCQHNEDFVFEPPTDNFDQMITDKGNEILKKTKPYLFNQVTGERLSENEALIAQHELELRNRENKIRAHLEFQNITLQRVISEAAAEKQLQDRLDTVHQLGVKMVDWATTNNIPTDYNGIIRRGWIIESDWEAVRWKGGYSVSHQGVQMSDSGTPVNKPTRLLLDKNSHFYRMRDRASKYATTRLIPVPYHSYIHINVNTLINRIAELSAKNDVPWKRTV